VHDEIIDEGGISEVGRGGGAAIEVVYDDSRCVCSNTQEEINYRRIWIADYSVNNVTAIDR